MVHKQYVIHQMCWEFQKKGNRSTVLLRAWGCWKTSALSRLLLAGGPLFFRGSTLSHVYWAAMPMLYQKKGKKIKLPSLNSEQIHLLIYVTKLCHLFNLLNYLENKGQEERLWLNSQSQHTKYHNQQPAMLGVGGKHCSMCRRVENRLQRIDLTIMWNMKCFPGGLY